MLEQDADAANFFLQHVRSLRGSRREILGAPRSARPQTALSIDLLQGLLAAEIACVTRYTLLSVSEPGLKNDRLATEFQAQANDERRHMAMLARRIQALGGVPDFSQAGLPSRVAALNRC